MTVDCNVKVENLNADQLDGLDSGAFSQVGDNHDALDIEADTLDGKGSTGFLAATLPTVHVKKLADQFAGRPD